MSVQIARSTSQKPVSSDALVEVMARQSSLSGQLFIGYPIINTAAGPQPIDALLVSRDRGTTVFDLIEGHNVGNYGVRENDSANRLEARLKTHRKQMRCLDLIVPIHTVSLAPQSTTWLPAEIPNTRPGTRVRSRRRWTNSLGKAPR